jgi:hypothetical protein
MGVPPPEVEASPFVRASGIGDCARKQFYRMTQTGIAIPRPGSAYGLLQAQQGNWIEEGIVPVIEAAGYEIGHRQLELDHSVDGELVLRGHIDGLIREKTGDIPSPWNLWECKGMSAFRYRKLVKNGVHVADPGYFQQVQAYMTLLHEEYGVTACMFTAVAKDPSSVNTPWEVRKSGNHLAPIYIERIPWDPAVGEELLQRADLLKQFADNKIEPPRERNPWKDWDCSPRFCEFYERCDPKANWRAAA